MRPVSLKNVSIIDLLITINQRYGDIPALQIRDGACFRSLSYVELGRRTGDVSYQLKKIGVQRGDRVAILSESRPEWAIAFFGIVSCGGITVPMDVKLSDTEIEFILNDSEARCIFVSKDFESTVMNLKSKLRHIENIITLDEACEKGAYQLKDFKVPDNEISYRDIKPEDTAIIVYTSGTTGVAKGVMLTYRNLLFEVLALNQYVHFNLKDQFLSILPLNHMLEITGGLIAPLYVGACITYCDSLKPTNIMRLMQETQTTTMISVPLVLKMFHVAIMKKAQALPVRKRKLFFTLLRISRFFLIFRIRLGRLFFSEVHKQFGGHLRCFVSGGAPLDPQVEEDFAALGFHILQGYGLTETSPVVTVNTFTEMKFGSVGIPLKGVEIKIVPSQERVREGEIFVRGPNVMRGYYKNIEKTGEVLTDGWFRTGDIGYLDRDGFLYITGRIKNMIVLGGGKKVFPEEIEEVMSQSPLIKEICVFGRTSRVGLRAGTEEVFAVIVPNFDSMQGIDKNDQGALKVKMYGELSRLSEQLADYKKISNFCLFFDDLPKTSTRKIKRNQVKELIGEG